MERESRSIRVHIEGRWTAAEMSAFLLALDELYSLRLALSIVLEDVQEIERYEDFENFPLATSRSRLSRRLRQYFTLGLVANAQTLSPFFPRLAPSSPAQLIQIIEPGERLEVQRIRYGSPGFGDLAGIGEAIGHLKDFLLRIVDIIVTRRERALENEARGLRNDRLRIENAQQMVSLARDCGYSNTEIRQMTRWVDKRQQLIIPLMDESKITHISDGEARNDDEPTIPPS